MNIYIPLMGNYFKSKPNAKLDREMIEFIKSRKL